ncbi:MAG: hypothetical protein ACYSWR_02480 [Planctomycetota bacterium]|jgi:hypothetical protein
MSIADFLVIATFTTPELIQTKPALMLWLLPLAASLALTYKATKLPKITPANFIKETAVLFAVIILLIIMIVLALYALAWLITE